MPTPAPLPLLPDPLGVPLDDQPLDDGHRLDEGQSLDDGHRLDDQLPEPSLPDELHQEEPLHELPEDDHHDEPDELHDDQLPEELGHQDELGQVDELLDELQPDELLLDQPLDEPLELPELDPEELPELLPDELPLDDPLDDEDDDEQHPSPRATTSHLRLSSNRLASPNVPAGTDSAGGQSHPSPDVLSPRHRSGQTTPIESWTVTVTSTGHHLPSWNTTGLARADPHRDSGSSSWNRSTSSASPSRTTAHRSVEPPSSSHSTRADPAGALRSDSVFPGSVSAKSYRRSGSTTSFTGVTPATTPRPMASASSGSSSTANRPAAIGSYGVPPSNVTRVWNSPRLSCGPMIGSERASTANRGSANPVVFRTATMPVCRANAAGSRSASWNCPRTRRAASANALYAAAGTSSR